MSIFFEKGGTNFFLFLDNTDKSIKSIYNLISSKHSDIIKEINTLAKRSKDPNFFQKLFVILTGINFDKYTSKILWEKIQKHYKYLSSKLGRNIHISSVVADYFLEVQNILINPSIVELAIIPKIENEILQDIITGFYKEKYFESFVSKEINRSKRHSYEFSLMIIQVNGIGSSPIVPEIGYAVRVILDIAKIINKIKRSEDIAFKSSINKFELILAHTNKKGAIIFANRLLNFINNDTISTAILLLGISLNIGIQSYPEDGIDAKTLLKNLEKALYKSKIEGPNKISSTT